jgi:hypothetical protein
LYKMTSTIANISNWDSGQEVANTEKGMAHWPTESYFMLFSDYTTLQRSSWLCSSESKVYTKLSS